MVFELYHEHKIQYSLKNMAESNQVKYSIPKKKSK